jgi:hypothetical protein
MNITNTDRVHCIHFFCLCTQNQLSLEWSADWVDPPNSGVRISSAPVRQRSKWTTLEKVPGSNFGIKPERSDTARGTESYRMV